MKEQDYMDNHCIEDVEYRCPYKEMADDPRYLYVHVSVFYAWGLKERREYDFLYDSKWHSAVCRDAKDGHKVRLPLFRRSINPDRMFRRNPKINWSYCDVTFYFITMKSGSRERELTIASPDYYLYKPFYWVLDTIGKDYGNHPRTVRRSAAFIAFLCRILKPFNIGFVNEIAKDLAREELIPNDDIFMDSCHLYFQVKEQEPPLKMKLNKFDPTRSLDSTSKDSTSIRNKRRRKINYPRKRPLPR